jgi:hypothetical protein
MPAGFGSYTLRCRDHSHARASVSVDISADVSAVVSAGGCISSRDNTRSDDSTRGGNCPNGIAGARVLLTTI